MDVSRIGKLLVSLGPKHLKFLRRKASFETLLVTTLIKRRTEMGCLQSHVFGGNGLVSLLTESKSVPPVSVLPPSLRLPLTFCLLCLPNISQRSI